MGYHEFGTNILDSNGYNVVSCFQIHGHILDKHVIEGSIWGIGWGGILVGLGFSLGDWVLILLESFPDCGLWIDFSVACFKRV